MTYLNHTRICCGAAMAVGFLLYCMFTASATDGRTEWQKYVNARWGFCVDVPTGWPSSEGSDKAGIFVHLAAESESGIEIGGRVNQPSNGVGGRLQTLDEIFSETPDVLNHVEDSRVVEKRHVTVQSLPGIRAKITYQEEGQNWIAENLTLLSSKGIVYLIEARFREDQADTFEKLFSHTLRSFQPTCSITAASR